MFPYRELRHPKNWLLLIGYVCIRGLVLLPLPILLCLGRFLGYMGYLFAFERKSIAAINLRACFPQLTEEERKKLLKAHCVSIGISAIEMILAHWGSETKLRKIVTICGMENLQNALQQGKGVILLCPHLTMVDLAVRLINLYTQKPIHIMYQRHRNPVLEYFVARARGQYFGRIIDKKSVRSLVDSLRSNAVVGYAPDQDFNQHIVFVPFFGVIAATTTATHRIAKMTGCSVVPLYFYRAAETPYRIKLEVLPALTTFPSDDETADCARINQVLESIIKPHPEQYLWMHRRFKTRPPEEKGKLFYDG